MNPRHLCLSAGICAAAFALGYGGKLQISPRPVGSESAALSATRRVADRGQVEMGNLVGKDDRSGGLVLLPVAHSTDTVETLLALDDDAAAYRRVALWMLDATEPEIANYWQGLSKRKRSVDSDLANLTFIHWTRLNPAAAIAAAKGTKYDNLPWWAWAAHDPQAALDRALATKGSFEESVAAGAAQFQPAWLRAHFDGLSPAAREEALSFLTHNPDTAEAREMLDFMQAHSRVNNGDLTFATLAARDPVAAYEWLRDHPINSLNQEVSQDGRLDQVVAELAKSQPETLKQLAGAAAPGEAKRKMEAALFAQLLASDPAAALQQAQATKAPRIAAERLAAVAMEAAKTNPAQALELARQMLAIYPEAYAGYTMLKISETPGMSSGQTDQVPGVPGLFENLMGSDPAAVLALPEVRSASSGGTIPAPIDTLEYDWANKDTAGFAAWIGTEQDPQIRRGAIQVVTNTLSLQGKHAEAADWAIQIDDSNHGALAMALFSWTSEEGPDAAKQWLEHSTLPEKTRQELINRVSPPPSQ